MDVVKLDVQSSSYDQQIKQRCFGIALERMTASNSVAARLPSSGFMPRAGVDLGVGQLRRGSS